MNYCQFRNDFIKRMANAEGGLPAEYQQVEYIEATQNNTYINTGRKVLSNNITATLKLLKVSTSGNDMTILGNQDNSTYRFVFGTYNGNWYLYNRTANSSYANATTAYEYNVTDITIEINSNQKRITKNGIVGGWYSAAPITNNNRNLVLFRTAVLEDGFVYQYYGRLYYFDYSEDGLLIFKMYPCYRKSDNKPGMYDIVTDTFFTNAGSGEFTVGNPV